MEEGGGVRALSLAAAVYLCQVDCFFPASEPEEKPGGIGRVCALPNTSPPFGGAEPGEVSWRSQGPVTSGRVVSTQKG